MNPTPLRTLIIDDEPIALEKLRAYTSRLPFLELAAACQNGFDALEFLSANEVDLIITDINMPDLNGLEFIRSLSRPPMVIFTTAYSEYAIDSYKVSAIDYLLKPYEFPDFSRAASKALERSRQTPAPAPDSSIFVKVDVRYVRVDLADIRYIKGYGEYLQIYLCERTSPLLTLSSFAAIRERLTDNFLQVHRSYIVNMNRVEQIERARLIMDPDTYIPVGDSYKPAFAAYLASHALAPRRPSATPPESPLGGKY